MLVLALILAAAPLDEPLELRLNAAVDDCAAGRATHSVGAGIAIRSPLPKAASLELTAGIGRDLPLIPALCIEPPKLSVAAAISFDLGVLSTRFGTTIESGSPRLDAAVSLGPLSIETEGMSTMRVVASFDL